MRTRERGRLRAAVAGICLALVAACAGPERVALVADAGTDQIVGAGDTVVLDGTGSTGPARSYNWRLESAPAGSAAALADPTSEKTHFVADLAGDYVAVLTVESGQRRATDRVTITAEARPTKGVLLGGDPSRPVTEAVRDYFVPAAVRDDLTTFDPAVGGEVLRTEIDLELVDAATAGEVDALLEDVDGRIVSMVAHAPFMVVRIPDPGDLPALHALLDTLEARDAVATAAPTMVGRPPQGEAAAGSTALQAQDLPPDLLARDRVDHQLAVRAAGAWNARRALPGVNDRPWVVQEDFFGNGQPTGGYDIQSVAGDFGTSGAQAHGYHVLGIITGDFGAGTQATARTDVTGLYPGTLRVRAGDLQKEGGTFSRGEDLLVQRMNAIVAADADARIVVNTSLGFTSPATTDSAFRNRLARRYIRELRSNGLEGKVVHVTSAGNTSCSVSVPKGSTCPAAKVVSWDASVNSPYAYAALGTVKTWLGARVDNLEDVLVVENRTNTLEGGLQRPVPACADASSIMGGSLSAIGTNVWSFGLTGGTNMTGTSMATPQVAGLAAYAWSFDPAMSSKDVVALLKRTARDDYDTSVTGDAGPRGCNVTAPKPVIDALDAVLASGGDAARRAMLDVADGSGAAGADGRFDEHDLQRFVTAYAKPPTLDYGRFDLNGDGITDGRLNGGRTERFDLDGDGGYAVLATSFLDADVRLDESAVTDADILCFYAYSPLYQGSARARNALLAQPCGIVRVSILDPHEGDTFHEGDAVGFTVQVDIRGAHEGDVILYTRGIEQDRYRGYSYLDRWPVTTLATREICPEDPVAEVVFRDPSTGLEARDTVRLKIDPSRFAVAIAGPNPRFVRVAVGSGGLPAAEDVTLDGSIDSPTCHDPYSRRIDPAPLQWLSATGSLLGEGPGLDLPGTYLRDPAGGFGARDVVLFYDQNGMRATDRVRLQPCSSHLGLDGGDSAVDGYAECPLSAVIGAVLADLRSTFGTIDVHDTERIVGWMINGTPDFRAVLAGLGQDPCDPTVCDPEPPGFPHDQAELQATHYGDRGPVTEGYLDDLFKVLASPTLGEFRSQLDGWLQRVGAESAIGTDDRALLTTAASVGLAAVDVFAPVSTGGDELWRSLGFAGDAATLVERVDPLAPAARGVLGYLSAVADTGARQALDSALYLHAAAYGASLEALHQASEVASSGR